MPNEFGIIGYKWIFYFDSIEISILLTIKSIGYGKSARRVLSSNFGKNSKFKKERKSG